MKIKICGIKTEKAALCASKEKADFIGLVFVKGVRREISVDQGIKIVNSINNNFNNPPSVVGLFQNQFPSYVENIARKSKLDFVKLCGDNDDFSNLSVPSIRQIRIKPEYSKKQIQDKVFSALDIHSLVILDSYDKEKPGGTGKTFNWDKILEFKSYENIFIAGGLNSENIYSLLSQLIPWGVDISSGVETNGEKDLKKISTFIKKVRAYNQS